jgi:SAM-dependent methyltransferase
MDTPASRTREVFFEIHSGLPREAPGDEASTLAALARVPALAADSWTLDLGCGPGPATILLARHTAGRVVALELHRPFLHEVLDRSRGAGVDSRVEVVHADMESPPFAPSTFDLVWSEGALYSVGLGRGLGIVRDLLKPGGHLVFSDVVWLTDKPPEEARSWWEGEYPDIAPVGANLHRIREAGFVVLHHFTLPDEAWWAYYRPVEARLEKLRSRHAGDPTALEVLDEAQVEVDMYRRHGRSYGYEMFVCRKPS